MILHTAVCENYSIHICNFLHGSGGNFFKRANTRWQKLCLRLCNCRFHPTQQLWQLCFALLCRAKVSKHERKLQTSCKALYHGGKRVIFVCEIFLPIQQMCLHFIFDEYYEKYLWEIIWEIFIRNDMRNIYDRYFFQSSRYACSIFMMNIMRNNMRNIYERYFCLFSRCECSIFMTSGGMHS